LNCPASLAATNLGGLVMPNDRNRPLGAVSVAMASVPAGVGLARKRRQFRKPLPVWCIIRIAGARA